MSNIIPFSPLPKNSPELVKAMIELAEALHLALEEIAGSLSNRDFLATHEAVHALDSAPAVDVVAQAFEREFWRRFPEGRDDDA